MASDIQTLSSISCVLKAIFPSSKLESSCCGTVIDPQNGVVLSHGSILTEHCAHNKSLSAKIRDGKLLRSSDFPNSDFSLLLSHDFLSVESSRNFENQNALVTMGTSSVSNNSKTENSDQQPLSSFQPVRCRFVGGFRNCDFHNTLTKMMPSSVWTFSDPTSDDPGSSTDGKGASTHSCSLDEKRDLGGDDMNDTAFRLLSYFLLFKFSYSDLEIPKDSLIRKNQGLKASSVLANRRAGRCFIGETAEIIATPFASLCPAVFFNGYSRGVVSNVAGVNGCWIVSDARCIPGSEGAPLYTQRKPSGKDSYLTGIITSPLCWKNNEWVGFSVACSIDSILTSMAQSQILLLSSNNYLTSARKESGPFDKNVIEALAMTVVVQCGSTWGTGVIIDRDQGIVLTCSHVIKGADCCSVTLTPRGSTTQHRGEVIYRQTPVRTAYDIALIKCPPVSKYLPLGWNLPVAQACIGEDILLSGHAVFGTDKSLEPSICRGVVSKVIRSQGQPVMVQTTCAVHAGSSGGPVLTRNGRLVGIVVCNTRDSVRNTSFPHVNLCIPAWTVWPAIENYLSCGDEKSLSRLQVEDVELNKLWALGSQACQGAEIVHTRSKL